MCSNLTVLYLLYFIYPRTHSNQQYGYSANFCEAIKVYHCLMVITTTKGSNFMLQEEHFSSHHQVIGSSFDTFPHP